MADPKPNRVISRDEMLLWLNDRIGRDVGAYIVADAEGADDTTMVAMCEGELRHWSGAAGVLDPVPEVRGMYVIGGAMRVNVTYIGPAVLATEEEGLIVQVAEGVEMSIVGLNGPAR
jgi:hypothetical protein